MPFLKWIEGIVGNLNERVNLQEEKVERAIGSHALTQMIDFSDLKTYYPSHTVRQYMLLKLCRPGIILL
jgi:hypothetical protein